MSYKVGQKLWLAGGRLHKATGGSEITITKVGHKWITFDRGYGRPYRFNPEDGSVDAGDYTPTEHVYESQEAFQAMLEAANTWTKLRRAVERHNPTCSVEAMREAAKLLGITLE